MSPVVQYRRAGNAWLPHRFGRNPPIVDSFVLGLTRPTASNTGYRTEPTITYDGPTNITTPFTIIKDRIIEDYLTISCADVFMDNCLVIGPDVPASSGSRGLISAFSTVCRRLVIQNTTIRPQAQSPYVDGIAGHDYTASRCDISGTTDGFGVGQGPVTPGSASGVNILGNYVHDLAYQTPFSGQSDNQTHNDCIQVHGQTDTLIRGNSLQAFGDPDLGNIEDNLLGPTWNQVNACLLVGPTAAGGVVNGLKVLDNWFGGGVVQTNISQKSLGVITGLLYQGNRHARNARYNNPTLVDSATLASNASSWTNNAWLDTGSPIAFTAR